MRKIRFITEIRRRLSMSLFILTLFQALNGQDCRPLPIMWVSDSLENVRKDWFRNGKLTPGVSTKFQIASKIFGKPHPPTTYYPAVAFDSLIYRVKKDLPDTSGGIRMYFVSYSDVDFPEKPANIPLEKNQLFFLYVAAKSKTDSDMNNYYLLLPNDPKVYNIPLAVKRVWFANFNNLYMNQKSGLPTTIEKNAIENQDKNDSTLYTDTRSVYYPLANFSEFFVDERNYQDSNSVNNPAKLKISKVAITLGSYTNKGIGPNIHTEPEDWFKSRLIVFFDFERTIAGVDRLFSIDSQSDFSCRKSKTYRNYPLFSPEIYGGGDNGHLCPPNCP